ncbi:FAD:protein FMN transferase [Gemmatimonadota bacterium]
MKHDQVIRLALLAGTVIIVAVALQQTRSERESRRYITLTSEPQGIMGTTCRLAVVTRPVDESRATEALASAESILRSIELDVSSWLEGSRISRFNQARAGDEITLSATSQAILQYAHDAWQLTEGTFDVTVRPLIQLWREAAGTATPPGDDALETARQQSSWDLVDLTREHIIKRGDGVEIDLGGIAKGYAIDQAVEALQGAGAAGGLVDVGGDLRVFGQPPDGRAWRVVIRDPSGSGALERLTLPSGAVCTSGDYSRFYEIGGERYSHIIDPRTGRPAAAALSVSVIATTALEADIWATSLSILGPQGLAMVPDGMEAMMVVTMLQDGVITHNTVTSPLFEQYIDITDR